MESTELMINDLVKDDHDNIIHVEELLYFGINGEWDGDKCYGANAVYELLSPIPLDDRILDLNFKKENNTWILKKDIDDYGYITKNKKTMDESKRYKFNMFFNVGTSELYVNHVHELQHILRLAGFPDYADNFRTE